MIRRASRRSFRAGGDERWLAQWRPTYLSGLVLWLRADMGITLNDASVTAPDAFDNAAWSKVRSSISANATPDPFGGNAADKLIEDATATSTHQVTQSVTALVAGPSVTISVYAKADARSWLFISSDVNGAYFNVSAGTLGSVIGGTTTRTIISAGNGWFLCSMTYPASSANIFFTLANGDGGNSYSGDGVSGLYLFRASVSQPKVSAWADQSGQSNSVIQGTAALQPLYVGTSANMGGRPSLQFTAASAHRLVNASFAALSGLAGATIFTVAKDSTQSNEYIFGTVPMRFQLSAGEITCRASDVDYVSAGTAAPATKSVFEATYDGSLAGNTNRLKSQINGGAAFANSTGVIPATLPATTGLTVGAYDAGAAPFEQEIAEMIIYTRTLSVLERSRIRNYMGARYGITVS